MGAMYMNKAVVNLNVASNPMRPKGAHAFGQMLLQNTTLATLNLTRCKLTDAGEGLGTVENGIVTIANALAENTTLDMFEMAANGLHEENESMRAANTALSDALHRNTRILKLST